MLFYVNWYINTMCPLWQWIGMCWSDIAYQWQHTRSVFMTLWVSRSRGITACRKFTTKDKKVGSIFQYIFLHRQTFCQLFLALFRFSVTLAGKLLLNLQWHNTLLSTLSFNFTCLLTALLHRWCVFVCEEQQGWPLRLRVSKGETSTTMNDSSMKQLNDS